MMRTKKKTFYLIISMILGLILYGCSGGGGSSSGDSGGGGQADMTAPTTTALPAGGSYTSIQSVTLSASETATIYYTTDGSTPTTSSSIYSNSDGISISTDTTLQYFAVDSSGNSETVKTETYVIQLSVSISGTAMKGVVADATVSIFELNSDGTKGDLLQTTTTDSNGEYSLSFVSGSSNSCYMVEITDGVYTDEILGSDITMESSDVLRAVECGGAGESNVLAVTPLTSIAASRATTLAAAGGTLTTAVTTSNLGVAQQYGIDSILTTIPVDPTSTAATELATRSQRNYGVVLAGMAQLADTNDVRAIDFAAALADDIVDGIMDGQGASGGITINRISTGTYIIDRDDGVGNLQNEIDNFLADPNNKANVDNMNIGPTAVNVGLNTAGRVYVTTTVLPAWIEGQSGSVTLTATDGTEPYVWSVPADSALPSGFNLAANGLFSGTASLLAPGSTMSISPPFTVRVTDANGNSSDLVLHLTVIKEPPTITINTCSNATVDEAYTCNVATGAGGVPPYYYVLNSGGAFPPFGLTLGTNGTVTGTPTVVGSRTFSVCVVDSAGAKDCADATINVVPVPLPTGQVTFWSSIGNEGNISIYVDGSYVGALSQYYNSTPSCGASGGLTLELTVGSHSYTASSDADTTWSGSITITEGRCLLWELRSSGGGSCLNTFTCGGGNLEVTQLASCGGCPSGTNYYNTIYIGNLEYYQCVCP
jgi:hypothetical protein